MTRPNALFDVAEQRVERRVARFGGKNWPYWFSQAHGKKRGTVLLIHGYRGTHHGLLTLVGALTDFDCIVPDLPGFGEAPEFEGEHTLDSYAEWVWKLFDDLELPKDTIVLGHSFGSLVVGKAATIRDTQRVVLVNPVSVPALEGPHAFMSRLTDSYYAAANALGEKLGRRLLSIGPVIWLVTESLFKGKDAELKKWVATQHKAHFSSFSSTRSATEGYRASVSHNLTEYAPKISKPVLLICAAKDDITSIADQRRVAERYGNATYVEIPDYGHLLHYQAPEEVALHVREFAMATKH